MEILGKMKNKRMPQFFKKLGMPDLQVNGFDGYDPTGIHQRDSYLRRGLYGYLY